MSKEVTEYAIQNSIGEFYTGTKPDEFCVLEPNAYLFQTKEEAEKELETWGFPNMFEIVKVRYKATDTNEYVDEILVSDGSGVYWICERADLLKALEKLSWEFSRDELNSKVIYFVEPELQDGYDAYTQLCENVSPIREGSELTENDYELPGFTYRPDIISNDGEKNWTLDNWKSEYEEL